ncbi:bifunctional protein-serine/threonine kinase/phosphatase [Methylobacillus gramineus]|uniref:bifunctional protein-serine/threonine kinase/phosphatase n=1 Tax=Methylobacillus gramineus TaxID=755169 RepID=UPI001CFF8A43|nr:bifunctional protein-serine/threonine kinase/phosphatase [Methylobacillus gramineus]MCB5185374.1 bifunctional protein-serine/threonine kinase/phosphatase [Methylobacillus gramineus]
MALSFKTGSSSVTGQRERNEDFAGMVTPTGATLNLKGAIFAVADGVSGNAGGREAAEMTVRSLLTDFYATPDTWEIPVALDKVIIAANRWLLAQALQHREMAGMATTLSLLVLRGQRYYSGHVGDSRLYRLRAGQLELLTTDHVWDRPDMRHVLKRAVGLDQQLSVDYAEGSTQAGDIYALMTDGVWGTLEQSLIHHTMGLYDNPQKICDELTRLALAAGGSDNATVITVRVMETGDETLTDFLAEGRQLTLPPKLKVGDHLDNFEVLEILHQSRASLVYKVKHRQSAQLWVLKTLQPILEEDRLSCQALLNEEWLAKRIMSQYLPQVLPLDAEQRSKLYYVMSWHEGATLQHRLEHGHHFTTAGITRIGIDILRGLGALHRLHILHRDIKPANLHMGKDNRLRILDLGVASSGNNLQEEAMPNPGTPSFMAPELFETGQASTRSDIYAAGVTLYYLLTRKYPYGEIEPFQHPRFGEPAAPTRYRPDIPGWLENIILKAVARNPALRFETAEEMLLALELGETRPILPMQRTPLISRAGLQQWQWLAVCSMLVNLVLIYLLFIS